MRTCIICFFVVIIVLLVVLVIVGALTALGLVRLWPHGNIHDHVAAGQGATYADGVTVHEATVQKAKAAAKAAK
mgnify:CR=1 FL=1